MKRCPSCNRTYTDDSLNFCLSDGQTLVGMFDEPAPTVMSNQPPFSAPNQAPFTSPNQQFGTAQTSFGQNAPSQYKPKSNTWVWVLVILGGLILVCGGGLFAFFAYVAQEANRYDTPTPYYSPSRASSPSTSSSGLTMEKYNKIQNGMTYDEVADILGGRGTQQSSSGEGKYKVETYKWEGEKYQFISVIFMGGKVYSKVQANVK